jgi:hypothetical protein
VQNSIELGIFDKLHSILFSTSATIIKEIGWVLSNITADSSYAVAQFVDHDIFERVMTLAENYNAEVK